MKKKIFNTPVSIVLAALLVSMSVHAMGAELAEIRVGRHADFSRIVFEFKGDVQHRISRDADSDRVSIRFDNALSNISAPAIAQGIACITGMSMTPQENDLMVNIALSTTRFQWNAFTIQDPFRMVLDISCPAEPVADPAPAAPVPEPIAPAPSVETAPSRQPEMPPPPAVVEGKPSPPSMNVQPAPPEAAASHQNALIVILGALSLVIIALAGILIRQNRASQEKLLQNTGTARLKQTEEMLSSIDAKIREKLKKHNEH